MAVKVRISLSRNSGKSRGKVLGVVVVDPTFEALAKAACNKLKISAKQSKTLRLFRTDKINCTELFAGTDIPNLLKNGDTVAVSVGEDFIRPDGFQQVTTKTTTTVIPPPPLLYFSTNISTSVQHTFHSDKKIEIGKQIDLVPEDNTHMLKAKEAFTPTLQNDITQRDELNDDKYPMNGMFPIFNGPVLDDIKKVIRGHPAFFMKDRGEFVCFDYSTNSKFSAIFPDPSSFLLSKGNNRRSQYEAALLRECRGLLVSRETGQVISRRFHKFWNLNELKESSNEVVNQKLQRCFDEQCDVLITEKIDGSLCSPFLLKSNQYENGSVVRWALRTSICEPVETFVKKSSESYDDLGASSIVQGEQNYDDVIGYEALARDLLEADITPLFEWCDTVGAVGVIHHTTQSLTLLAARNMISGNYLERSELMRVSKKYQVPIVNQVKVDLSLYSSSSSSSSSSATVSRGPSNFIQGIVSDWVGKEGVVLSLGNHGEMGTYKVKSNWYVSIAAACKVNSINSSGGGGGSTVQKHCYELMELLKLWPCIQGVPTHLIWSTCLASLKGQEDDSVSWCKSQLMKLSSEQIVRAGGNIKGGMKEGREEVLISSFQVFESKLGQSIDMLVDTFMEWRENVLKLPSIVQLDDIKLRKQCIMEHASKALEIGWSSKLINQVLHQNSTTFDNHSLVSDNFENIEKIVEESSEQVEDVITIDILRHKIEMELINLIEGFLKDRNFKKLRGLIGVEWNSIDGTVEIFIKQLQQSNSNNDEPKMTLQTPCTPFTTPTPRVSIAAAATPPPPPPPPPPPSLSIKNETTPHTASLVPSPPLVTSNEAMGRVTSEGRVEWWSDAMSQDQILLSSLLNGYEDRPMTDSQMTGKVVVILRGLPGCGKSFLTDTVVKQQHPETTTAAATTTKERDTEGTVSSYKTTAVCSADSFFEKGAGIMTNKQKKKFSKDEIYLKCFDKNKLQEAHDHCRVCFQDAIAEQIDIIIVDNTNLQKKEYAFYQRKASSGGYKCIVVELIHTPPSPCSACDSGYLSYGWGKHGVSAGDIGRMRARWEFDKSAITLQSWTSS